MPPARAAFQSVRPEKLSESGWHGTRASGCCMLHAHEYSVIQREGEESARSEERTAVGTSALHLAFDLVSAQTVSEQPLTVGEPRALEERGARVGGRGVL